MIRAGGGVSWLAGVGAGHGSPSGRSRDHILRLGERHPSAWHARNVSDLSELRDRMRVFTDARDWGQFHDPKSLLLALVGEVGELSELLQWLPASNVEKLASSDALKTRLGEELADVLIYLADLRTYSGVTSRPQPRESSR